MAQARGKDRMDAKVDATSRQAVQHARRRERPMLSAVDLARRIEAGDLTPTAALDRCAEAIAERESEVGAFAALDLANVRADLASRAALASQPLRGLAIGIKDIFETADLPTAYGSP